VKHWPCQDDQAISPQYKGPPEEGAPEMMSHESAIKHIIEENKLIKTKKHFYLLMKAYGPTLMDLDPQQSRSAAQVGSILC